MKWLIVLFLSLAIVRTADAAQPTVERDNRAMCEEVAYELNLQVDLGMISREKADKAINRCFELYSPSK